MFHPFPVRATNHLEPPLSLLVPENTPGEIVGMSGKHYTVTFWPFGPDGASLTLCYLTEKDLAAA